MSDIREVKVPDIGDFDEVDVIEVLVSEGDTVSEDDSLITLESDKAAMEIPSPVAGRVASVEVSVGDKVGEGDLVATVEVDAGDSDGEGSGDDEPDEPEQDEPEQEEPPADDDAGAADEPAAEESGEERDASAEEGEPDRSDDGREASGEEAGAETRSGPRRPPASKIPRKEDRRSPPHASPGIRRFARQLGVDLHQVEGSGRKGRILQEDVEEHVREVMERSAGGEERGSGIPAVPAVDFSKFGPTEEIDLSRIRKVAARNLSRSWLNVPHVTQFDQADVTELEEFRKARKDEAAERGVKLTPLAFLMKAAVAALKEYPDFNSSLHPSGEKLIRKGYFHLGIAVDTPNGLVVPVVRDVDEKGLWELAEELGDVSERARKGRLSPADIQGASFTISSLGGIGGTNFTPIVNAPEVAILGVARSKWQPEWNGSEFVPRLILPFSVSYDHRVIDGAAGVRFTGFLSEVLTDVRRLLL